VRASSCTGREFLWELRNAFKLASAKAAPTTGSLREWTGKDRTSKDKFRAYSLHCFDNCYPVSRGMGFSIHPGFTKNATIIFFNLYNSTSIHTTSVTSTRALKSCMHLLPPVVGLP